MTMTLFKQIFIDMKLIERMLDTLRNDKTLEMDVAINLSGRSIIDSTFYGWFALIGDLAAKRESQFFISSIVKITQSLDIMAIANGIESEALLPLLKELGVDGYQRYVTGALARSGYTVGNLEFPMQG